MKYKKMRKSCSNKRNQKYNVVHLWKKKLVRNNKKNVFTFQEF